jgi:ATP-binding cassette subfamily F protein uup
MVFEGTRIEEYVGGYDDWQRQRAGTATEAMAEKRQVAGKETGSRGSGNRRSAPKATSNRLSYREQQELVGLPQRIEQLEAEIASLHDAMAAPEFYKQSGDDITRETNRLRELESQLAEAYHRWEELEQRSA